MLEAMPADVLSPPAAGSLMAEAVAHRPRVVSLDVFRGLNLALMIFVNELAEVHNLPWWTYHAPGRVDVMTYVDMVFPGFLLILGMSLPLAIGSRVRRGDSTGRLVGYVALRAVALIVLGLILANADRASDDLMNGFPAEAWALLALAGAVLVWLDYRSLSQGRLKVFARRRMQWAMRATGLVLLVVMAAVFRRMGHNGGVRWLSFGYPEILGLIGYTYFAAGLCYLLTRRWRWACAGWFVLFTAMNALESAKLLHTPWPWWVWPLGTGSMMSLVFAGVVLSTIFFLEPRLVTFRAKAVPALALGAVCAVAALLLTPLGVSKIRATPTWVLYTVAACCAAYTLLYWICDVRGHTRWALPVRSAGSNTLLTYLLPDAFYFAIGLLNISWLAEHMNSGLPGVLRAVVFTAVMLALSAVATRARLRLQL